MLILIMKTTEISKYLYYFFIKALDNFILKLQSAAFAGARSNNATQALKTIRSSTPVERALPLIKLRLYLFALLLHKEV